MEEPFCSDHFWQCLKMSTVLSQLQKTVLFFPFRENDGILTATEHSLVQFSMHEFSVVLSVKPS